MKKISIEEHFITQDYIDLLHARKEYPKRDFIMEDGRKLERDWWEKEHFMLMDPASPSNPHNKALDLGQKRIRDMDAAGIDMQVLSFVAPNTSLFDPSEDTSLAKKINNELARAVKKYPKRFAGFAYVAPQNPTFAAGELNRAVKELGLSGMAVAGHIRGDFLDKRKYWVILEKAAELDVPIYIHPGPPAPDMMKPYLAYPALSGALLGYAAGSSLHAMSLICSGVFDEYPNLKFILGHMGEALPYWLWRMDKHWKTMPLGKHLKKMPSEYIKDNFFITTSGMFWLPPMMCAYMALGADKILFAVDYPYESNDEAVRFIDSIPLGDGDREKICHLNTEKLFKL